MFSLTIRRADALADAMEVRLYNVNKRRINFRQNPWGLYDSFLVLIHMVMLLGIIFEGVVV
jgi:energy-coupling factor transporter transmembrane protein EcfT